MEKFGWHGKVSIFRKQSVRLHIPTVQQFSNSESSPGSYYKLQVRSNDQAQWTDVSDKIDQNVHIVTGNVIRTQIWPTTFLFRLGLIPGISYRFRVAQKNKTGDSIPSKASQRIGINIWAGQSRTPYNSFHAWNKLYINIMQLKASLDSYMINLNHVFALVCEFVCHWLFVHLFLPKSCNNRRIIHHRDSQRSAANYSETKAQCRH